MPVEDAEPSPFFEPLLRSFLLGVGAGVICESAHVLFKVGGAPAAGAGEGDAARP